MRINEEELFKNGSADKVVRDTADFVNKILQYIPTDRSPHFEADAPEWTVYMAETVVDPSANTSDILDEFMNCCRNIVDPPHVMRDLTREQLTKIRRLSSMLLAKI